MEHVATRKFSSCYHLVLADGAVFQLLHFSLMILLSICIYLLKLIAPLIYVSISNYLWISLYYKFDEREVTL